MDASTQIFIRNNEGKVWGPLAVGTVQLLIDNGMVVGKVEVSIDGLTFFPSDVFPNLSEFFTPVSEDELAPVSVAIGTPGSAPTAPVAAAAPMAGPGAVAAMAGPGAMKAAARPRTAPPHAAPPVIAPPIAPSVAPVAAKAPSAPAAPPVAPAVPSPTVSEPARHFTDDIPASGTFSEHSPIRLYYLLASSDATGRLSLELGDCFVEVHFRKGNPELVTSTHPEDAMGAFLLREGLVQPTQLIAAEEADTFKDDLIGVLFAQGVLNPGQVFPYLTKRAHMLLARALLAREGRFSYERVDLPAQKAMPLGNRWGVLMEVARRFPLPELRARLGERTNRPIMKSGGRVPATDLRFSPHEARAFAVIDGVRSLAQIAADVPAETEHLFRLGYVLPELDILAFSDRTVTAPETPKAAAPPPPAVPPVAPPVAQVAPPVAQVAPKIAPPQAAKPAPAAAPAPSKPAPTAAARPTPAPATAPAPKPAAPVSQAPAAAPARPMAEELADLRGKVAKLKEQNHFQLLGVPENADASAVKIAYFKSAKAYHPDTVPQDAPAELGTLKAAMFAAIGEAYRTLSNEQTRADYVEKLKAGGGDDVDVAQILRAEELFHKGCAQVRGKKFDHAVETLSEAITANPEEGEFYAWRGAARFYAAKDRTTGRSEAEFDLGVALKKNPRCAAAYYFRGQIAKLSGDMKAASRDFAKTVELQPDHVDAQRELRLLQKK